METFTLVVLSLVLAFALVGAVLIYLTWEKVCELLVQASLTKAGVTLIVDHLDVQHQDMQCGCKIGKTTPHQDPNTLAADE